MCHEKRSGREGFSLVEMIIAIAIIGIVMSVVVLLISYSTNNMRRTNNMVNLQNQAKDGMLHITTHLQEGSDATWVDEKKALIVARKQFNTEGDVTGLEVSHYWMEPDTTTNHDSFVFVKNVLDFKCTFVDNTVDLSGIPVDPPGADPAVPEDTGDRNMICYLKLMYNGVADYLKSDGSVDFSKLIMD